MGNKDNGDKKITGWADKDGSFKRQVSSFRDQIEPNGKFAPEKGQSASLDDWAGSWAELTSAGRYHLYVSLACPWAHRALIVRQLKGLEEYMGESTSDSSSSTGRSRSPRVVYC
jgi:putative glutathione S-transferase